MEWIAAAPFPIAAALLFVVVLGRAGGTYAVGRLAHAGAARSRMSRHLQSAAFVRAETLIARWGAPVVAVSFLTIGFQTAANLAAGVLRMPLRHYLPALAVGGAAWALLGAAVGLAGFAAAAELIDRAPLVAVGAGAAAVLLLGTWIVLRLHRGRASARNR